jgi:CheY-like chemotaxis protein
VVRKTALIVDDDPAIVDGLAEYLEHDGYGVVAAANGREALVLLEAGVHPDVIVLDLLMPGMDGWDFRMAQLNKPSLAKIPVLIISASGFSSPTILKQLRVEEYLPKPLDPAGVVRALDRLSAKPPAAN